MSADDDVELTEPNSTREIGDDDGFRRILYRDRVGNSRQKLAGIVVVLQKYVYGWRHAAGGTWVRDHEIVIAIAIDIGDGDDVRAEQILIHGLGERR